MDRDRGVGEAGRIDHDAGGLLGAGLLNPVDDLALVVRLPELDREAVRGRGLAAELLDVLERGAAVDLRLARAEQVEVRAVEHVDGLGHGLAMRAAPFRSLPAQANSSPRQCVDALYRQPARKGEARRAAAGGSGCARSLRRRLDAQHLGDLGHARALLVDRGGELRGRAGHHDLPGGLKPRDDRRIGERRLDVGGDALAQLVRHVARAVNADQAVEGQLREAGLRHGRHAGQRSRSARSR